jgi:hypothetical protein
MPETDLAAILDRLEMSFRRYPPPLVGPERELYRERGWVDEAA